VFISVKDMQSTHCLAAAPPDFVDRQSSPFPGRDRGGNRLAQISPCIDSSPIDALKSMIVPCSVRIKRKEEDDSVTDSRFGQFAPVTGLHLSLRRSLRH